VQVRLKKEQLALLDTWISLQPPPRPSRPAAIREILMSSLLDAGRGKSEK
jgi:hypothetical protein